MAHYIALSCFLIVMALVFTGNLFCLISAFGKPRSLAGGFKILTMLINISLIIVVIGKVIGVCLL